MNLHEEHPTMGVVAQSLERPGSAFPQRYGTPGGHGLESHRAPQTMMEKFAALLGIRSDQSEDALRSERAAKHVVSRRSFFGVAAALAGGTLFSFGAAPMVEEHRQRLTITTFDAILKQIYTDDRIDRLWLTESPLMQMLEKHTMISAIDHDHGILTISSSPGPIHTDAYAFRAGDHIEGRALDAS